MHHKQICHCQSFLLSQVWFLMLILHLARSPSFLALIVLRLIVLKPVEGRLHLQISNPLCSRFVKVPPLIENQENLEVFYHYHNNKNTPQS